VGRVASPVGMVCGARGSPAGPLSDLRSRSRKVTNRATNLASRPNSPARDGSVAPLAADWAPSCCILLWVVLSGWE